MNNFLNRLARVSHYLFMLGLITSIVVGSLGHDAMSESDLFLASHFGLIPVILGIFVGLVNITKKEVDTYLIACSAFILSIAYFKFERIVEHVSGTFFDHILDSSLLFVIPITFIVSIKTIVSSAED